MPCYVRTPQIHRHVFLRDMTRFVLQISEQVHSLEDGVIIVNLSLPLWDIADQRYLIATIHDLRTLSINNLLDVVIRVCADADSVEECLEFLNRVGGSVI